MGCLVSTAINNKEIQQRPVTQINPDPNKLSVGVEPTVIIPNDYEFDIPS